ncbi:hypothetical protein CS369_08625 [Candidatus Symbiopectobacterium sp. 'North America']|nr:hypothetical protein [Candidatus Symbiopectobacterium sp. 'North America']
MPAHSKSDIIFDTLKNQSNAFCIHWFFFDMSYTLSLVAVRFSFKLLTIHFHNKNIANAFLILDSIA